jgi:hypothetical protein
MSLSRQRTVFVPRRIGAGNSPAAAIRHTLRGLIPKISATARTLTRRGWVIWGRITAVMVYSSGPDVGGGVLLALTFAIGLSCWSISPEKLNARRWHLAFPRLSARRIDCLIHWMSERSDDEGVPKNPDDPRAPIMAALASRGSTRVNADKHAGFKLRELASYIPFHLSVLSCWLLPYVPQKKHRRTSRRH